MVERPVAGLHYPAATGEFMAWFSTDADCLDYLEWLRWPEGLRLLGVRSGRLAAR
jgi:hypothetical protein